VTRQAIALGLLSLVAGIAQADGISLNAVRVTAEDVPATAKFYEAAFGLQEVQRLEFRNQVEIMLNFGATVEQAKANTNAEIVIMHRDPNSAKDSVPHVILTVTDITAAVAAVKAAGGTLDSEPHEFGKTGIYIGIASDPAGNRVEMIQQPKKK
jgi:predicted enzyme related to lactoylglutathione lyase